MDARRAEQRFRQLQTSRDRGELGDQEFRLQVATLLFRDARGVFWMLDAEDGSWHRNDGEGWSPGDPHSERALTSVPTQSPRRARWVIVGLLLPLLILLLLAASIWLWQWPVALESLLGLAPGTSVRIAISSPSSGTEVFLEQEVAIEATLQSEAGLPAVDRVEVRVDGVEVGSQPVWSRVGTGQTSLPVSLLWLPTEAGEHRVEVLALTQEGEVRGQASIDLIVAEGPDNSSREPGCTPDAAYVADITVPAGSVFPPGTNIEKVWQVRNTGTCAWGIGYELIPTHGREAVAFDAGAVPPTPAGALANVGVSFELPAETGTFTGTWRIRTADGLTLAPILRLEIQVREEAEQSSPPLAPSNLQAQISREGTAVRLSWQDESDDENAFRVHREDVEASIGIAPANAETYLDRAVTCGNTYRYSVAAFNAHGTSPVGKVVEVSLPNCAPTVVPQTPTQSP